MAGVRREGRMPDFAFWKYFGLIFFPLHSLSQKLKSGLWLPVEAPLVPSAHALLPSPPQSSEWSCKSMGGFSQPSTETTVFEDSLQKRFMWLVVVVWIVEEFFPLHFHVCHMIWVKQQLQTWDNMWRKCHLAWKGIFGIESLPRFN